MEDELGGMVRSVAKARKALAEFQATLAELTEKVDQLVQEHYGADLAKTTEQIALAQEVVESTETSLRLAILARFTFTGEKHPLDGINVREVPKSRTSRRLRGAESNSLEPSSWTARRSRLWSSREPSRWTL